MASPSSSTIRAGDCGGSSPMTRQVDPRNFRDSSSETGCYLSTRKSIARAGVIPFSVNAAQWVNVSHRPALDRPSRYGVDDLGQGRLGR